MSSHASTGRLADLYRINDDNLALRRQMLGFGRDDVRTLAKLAPWAERHADTIAREFYDWQFSFGPTRAFYERFAQQRGFSLPQLREHLEQAQATYFRQIFQEAAASAAYGVEYFERRLQVGRIHNVINLPLKWYIGSYGVYNTLVRKHLKQSYFHRPGLRAQAQHAILLIFLYDMQAVSDAFFYDYLQSIGLDLMAIQVRNPREEDLSEYYAELKSVVRGTLDETQEMIGVASEIGEQVLTATGDTSRGIGQVVQATQEVASGAVNTSEAATNSQDAISQLAQAIDSIASGASDQARQVQAAAEIASDMAERVGRVAAEVGDVSAASQHARTSAEHGAEAVRETVRDMNEIKRVVSDAAARVSQLGQLGERIGAVVETIDDIAEQTNLLALNAAIEAARAGEHGRGFAVVADEVRKLAERSQRETKAISDLIRDIQSGTYEAVRAMEHGSSTVEQGAAQADKAGAALAEILQAVGTTVTQVSSIAETARTMADGGQRVLAAMESISAVVEQNSAATEEMAAQTGQVTTSIESIAAVAEESSATAEELAVSTDLMRTKTEATYADAERLVEATARLRELFSRFRLTDTRNGSGHGSAAASAGPAPSGVARPARAPHLKAVGGAVAEPRSGKLAHRGA
ncbi:MAG: methyl-accepting chemotaxis protein [Chloroflexota bacterium]